MIKRKKNKIKIDMKIRKKNFDLEKERIKKVDE